MKYTTKLLLGLTIIVAGLILARIIMSSAFSVDGIALNTINGEIANLDKQNMLLKEKMYTMSSYSEIAKDATALGFVEEKSQLTISNTSTIAIKQ